MFSHITLKFPKEVFTAIGNRNLSNWNKKCASFSIQGRLVRKRINDNPRLKVTKDFNSLIKNILS